MHYTVSSQILIYIVLNMMMIYIIHTFLETYFLKATNIKNKWYYGIYTIYFICSNYLGINSIYPIYNIAFNLLMLSTIVMFYKSKWTHRLVAVLLIVIMMMGIEMVVPYLWSAIMHQPVESILVSESSVLFLISMARLMALVMVKLYEFIKGRQMYTVYGDIEFVDWLKVIFIPFCSIIILYTFYKIGQVNDTIFNRIIIISTLLILMINIVFYYLYDKLLKSNESKLENALLAKQVEYYTHQYKQIELNVKEMQAIKHNLKHQLIYLQAKIEGSETFKIASIKQEIEHFIGDIKIPDMLIYIDYTAINILLNYKINEAYKNHINVEVTVNMTLKACWDERVLCIILGNILDNAIEANIEVMPNNRNMTILIHEERGNLYIKISNPCVKDLIFKNALPVTTKKDTVAHGIGLKSVQELINRQGGVLRIDCKAHIFTIEILLYK